MGNENAGFSGCQRRRTHIFTLCVYHVHFSICVPGHLSKYELDLGGCRGYYVYCDCYVVHDCYVVYDCEETLFWTRDWWGMDTIGGHEGSDSEEAKIGSEKKTEL